MASDEVMDEIWDADRLDGSREHRCGATHSSFPGKAVKGKQLMTVQRADRSPMNPLRWCLTLSCGHETWVTSKAKPTRMKSECERCSK